MIQAMTKHNLSHLRSLHFRSCPSIKAMALVFLFQLSIYPAVIAQEVSSEPIVLPIEVLGEAGYIEQVAFDLTDATNVNKLYLKIHRPVFRDVSTNSARGAKASFRLNGGSWIDITNATAEVYDHEEAYGGLNGAYHTIRMNMPINNAQVGTNTLEFRFNGTDGFSIGYRVLEMNVLNGSQKQLPESTFEYDDPANWEAPLNNAADISEGEQLWQSAVLVESPLNSTLLRASCGSCHAADGRDLKYFNYSNWSIQERSEFHGLSETEAKQIASYIRSLDAPSADKGRPWNPPYQPGPGLDSQPVQDWAAGAGLEAVLETDSEVIPLVFNSTSKSDIKEVVNINKKLNTREVQTPIQYPDWNEWLPEIHPLDLVGDPFRTVQVTNMVGQNVAYEGAYEVLKEFIATSDKNTIAANGELYTYMNRFASITTQLHGESAFVLNNAIAQGNDQEDLNTTIVQWGAIKQWELMHTYDLEDLAQQVHGEQADERSWITLRRNVFDMAPHRTAKNIVNLPYQSVLVGKYFSTSWYQLQLSINAGNKRGYSEGPVDWNYQPDHIMNLKGVGGPGHPIRYILSHVKMLQQFNDGKKVQEGSMIGFRKIHPARFLKSGLFESLDYTLRRDLKDALLNATIDLITSHENNEWPRTSSPVYDNELRPSSYTPKIIDLGAIGNRLHEHDYEDVWMTMIPHFRDEGVSEATLNRAIDWGKEMWPNGNWEALRNEDTDQVPAAPSNLATTVGSSIQINLTWTDNSDNEDEFKIERKIAGGTFSELASVSPNTTSYSDNNLSPSTAYTYRILASNQIGNSSFSTEISATTNPDGDGTGDCDWVFAANENETVAISTATQVRYGANGTYVTQTVSSNIDCSNSAFGGDPVPGIAKTCERCNTTATIPVGSLSLDDCPEQDQLNGSNFSLSAVVSPANATDKSITWTSSNSAIASVNSDGLVTTIASGTVVITATSVNEIEATCEVSIIIDEPNTPPVANAGSDQNLTDSDNSGSESITLNGSGSSDNDGSIVTYIWSEGGTEIATGVSPTISLTVGTHNIVLTVTDNDGATHTDNLEVVVSEAATGNLLEAENASYVNGALTSNSSASNGKFVDGSGGFNITWNYNASTDGSTTIKFAVAAPSGTRRVGVFVNNNKEGVLITSAQRYNWEEISFTVPLQVGNNIIELRDTEGAAEPDVDYVVIGTTATNPDGDCNWVFTANENETVAISTTTLVRYGANGTYVTQTVSSDIACSNSAFGGDPVPGIVKTCERCNTGLSRQSANSNEENNGVILANTAESDVMDELLIFPNPALNSFNISIPADLKEIGTLTIHDLIGNKVYEQSIKGGTNYGISVETLSQGVYLIKVKSANYDAYKRLIKRAE